MNKISKLALLLLLALNLTGQHTFSIVAVDEDTGELGSAGATCLNSSDCGGCGGAIIISGIIPGKGAINAQAQVCLPNVNLELGLSRLRLDEDGVSVLDYMLANDACQFGTIADRQYGVIARTQGQITGATHTGSAAISHAGSRFGEHYSIQGNILLGPEILDSMEARFLASEGKPLYDRLMEAMQGANVPGADTRCFSEGTSSRSAFLRVAKPDDEEGSLYIDLNVPGTVPGIDPIDMLQFDLDNFKLTLNNEDIIQDQFEVIVTDGILSIDFIDKPSDYTIELIDLNGRLIIREQINTSKFVGDLRSDHTQLLIVNIYDRNQLVYSTKIISK